MKTAFNRFFNRFWAKVLTLLGFGSSFAFMACYGVPPTDYQLEIFPGDIELDAVEGSEAEITVSTNEEWEATVIPSYISLSDSSGTGTTVVTLRAESANQEDARRDTVVVISTGRGASCTVSVAQANRQPSN